MVKKEKYLEDPENSLVVQWLGLGAFTLVAWVQPLMGELRSTSHTGNKRSCLLQVRKGFTSERERIQSGKNVQRRWSVLQSLTSALVTWALGLSLFTSACVGVAGVPWAILRGCKRGRGWSTSTGCQRGVFHYLVLSARFTDEETQA